MFQHSPSLILFKTIQQYVHSLDRGRRHIIQGMDGYLISLTFIEHQNHNRVRTRTLGSNCRHTNSVPNTDDMEQISMFVLLKLQNKLRAEPLSIGMYLVNKQDNLSKSKNGILCKSTDYRLYFKNPHISLSSCEGQFLVPHYYQTVYTVYLLLSCSAGKVLSYRNIFFFPLGYYIFRSTGRNRQKGRGMRKSYLPLYTQWFFTHRWSPKSSLSPKS